MTNLIEIIRNNNVIPEELLDSNEIKILDAKNRTYGSCHKYLEGIPQCNNVCVLVDFRGEKLWINYINSIGYKNDTFKDYILVSKQPILDYGYYGYKQPNVLDTKNAKELQKIIYRYVIEEEDGILNEYDDYVEQLGEEIFLYNNIAIIEEVIPRDQKPKKDLILDYRKTLKEIEKLYYYHLGKEMLVDLLANENLPNSFREWVHNNNIDSIQYERVEYDDNGCFEFTNNLLFVSDISTTPVAAISIQNSEFFFEATNSQDRSSANIHYYSIGDMFDDFEDIEFDDADIEITRDLLEATFYELLREYL